MGLRPELLRGIHEFGFEQGFELPSAIQQRTIVPVVKGHDMATESQAGTGKTSAIVIAILQKLDLSNKETQALILVPTREIALQTQTVIGDLGRYMNIECHACVGGSGAGESMAKLQEGAHVVVGTTGRVCDVINRGALCTDTIRLFCLDEPEEILSRGFKDEIYEIFERLPQARQVVFFSHTMPTDVLEATTKFMRDPQFYILLDEERAKLDVLYDIFMAVTMAQAVIYCNSRQKVEFLAVNMRAFGFTVAAMHRDMGQRQRDRLRKEFHSASANKV